MDVGMICMSIRLDGILCIWRRKPIEAKDRKAVNFWQTLMRKVEVLFLNFVVLRRLFPAWSFSHLRDKQLDHAHAWAYIHARAGDEWLYESNDSTYLWFRRRLLQPPLIWSSRHASRYVATHISGTSSACSTCSRWQLTAEFMRDMHHTCQIRRSIQWVWLRSHMQWIVYALLRVWVKPYTAGASLTSLRWTQVYFTSKWIEQQQLLLPIISRQAEQQVFWSCTGHVWGLACIDDTGRECFQLPDDDNDTLRSWENTWRGVPSIWRHFLKDGYCCAWLKKIATTIF